jgi:cell division topological specificity factor
MSIFDYLRSFRSDRKNTASLAKERLQIIVSHERANRNGPDLPLLQLQQELIAVISKYVTGIDKDQVKVELERSGDCSILELNIVLPDRKLADAEI